MDRKFILTCGSTVDLPYDYCQQREIPVIFYTYVLDGVEREDDMERNPGMLEKFYQAMREGAIPQTSQINTERYIDFFTGQLKHGDVLHIAFGSGMSASVNNAMNAARELDGKIDGHRMMVVDSLCSSSGTVMFARFARKRTASGKERCSSSMMKLMTPPPFLQPKQ